MEEKKTNLPKEESKVTPDPKENVSSNLEDNKTIGIETDNTGLDKDSSKQKTLLSNLKFSKEQEEQVRTLLQGDLQTAVQGLKDEVKKEGQEIKKDFLTIFGLFASFVTFLSIEVQVFKNKDNVFELIGITSISLSFVMFFALVINDIAKDKSEWKDFLKPTYIFNAFFAVMGMIFLYIGGTSSIHRIDNVEKQIKSDSTIISFQKIEIQTLQTKVVTLDSLIRISAKPKPLTPTNNNENKKAKD